MLLLLLRTSNISKIKAKQLVALYYRKFNQDILSYLSINNGDRTRYNALIKKQNDVINKKIDEAYNNYFTEKKEPNNKKTLAVSIAIILKLIESKANTTIATELWRSVNKARLDTIIEKGYQYKTTAHIFDSRTGDDSIWYASTHQIKRVEEPFNYTWNGYERVFMSPPDRPNDRSIVIPFTE